MENGYVVVLLALAAGKQCVGVAGLFGDEDGPPDRMACFCRSEGKGGVDLKRFLEFHAAALGKVGRAINKGQVLVCRHLILSADQA